MSFNLLWLVRIILSSLDTIPNKEENFMISFLHLPVFHSAATWFLHSLILIAGVYTYCPREILSPPCSFPCEVKVNKGIWNQWQKQPLYSWKDGSRRDYNGHIKRLSNVLMYILIDWHTDWLSFWLTDSEIYLCILTDILTDILTEWYTYLHTRVFHRFSEGLYAV